MTLPHAFSGLVSVIVVELRHTEHSFRHQCKQTKQLNVEWRVDEGNSDNTRQQSEQCHELNVTSEVGPLPEVINSQVYNVNATTNPQTVEILEKSVLTTSTSLSNCYCMCNYNMHRTFVIQA